MGTVGSGNRIGVVGDRDSVMLFKALGIDAAYADTREQGEKALHRFAQAEYAVIYVTEKIAEQIQEAIGYYKSQPLPAIVPIPDRTGSTGMGMRGIRKDVEKAIGADILFGEGR